MTTIVEKDNATKPQISSNNTLRDAVSSALEKYFSQLDGKDPSDLYELVIAEIESPFLEVVMRFTRNNQSRAARLMGLSRGTLRKKLKIYDML